MSSAPIALLAVIGHEFRQGAFGGEQAAGNFMSANDTNAGLILNIAAEPPQQTVIALLHPASEFRQETDGRHVEAELA
jgi:hypothetical protein